MAEDFAFSPDELPEDRSLILVDDDRAFVLRLARAMETRGFEVRVAHSVAEGMDLIRQKAPPPENPMSADRVRWEHIQRVYELCNRNVSETARRLNMHRRTLQRILAKRAPK